GQHLQRRVCTPCRLSAGAVRTRCGAPRHAAAGRIITRPLRRKACGNGRYHGRRRAAWMTGRGGRGRCRARLLAALRGIAALREFREDLRQRLGLRQDVEHATAREDRLDHLPVELRRDVDRSEEHTSELQSRENLVCRLLLEKKNDARRLSIFNPNSEARYVLSVIIRPPV